MTRGLSYWQMDSTFVQWPTLQGPSARDSHALLSVAPTEADCASALLLRHIFPLLHTKSIKQPIQEVDTLHGSVVFPIRTDFCRR